MSLTIFCHIPKCSGSSMLRSLEDAGRIKKWKNINLFANVAESTKDSWEEHFSPTPEIQSMTKNYAKKIFSSHQRNLQKSFVVHHHYPVDVSSEFVDARYLILIRDPLYRAISHWKHYQEKGNVILSFEQFVNKKPNVLTLQSFWFNDIVPKDAKKFVLWVEDYHVAGPKTQILAQKLGIDFLVPQYYQKTKMGDKKYLFSQSDFIFLQSREVSSILKKEREFLQFEEQHEF
jgi:hypothetical protein